MKKLLLIPALLTASLALAEQKKLEISPMIGYNIAEANFNIKDDGYVAGALELQFNSENSKISPEFSLLYSDGVAYDTGSSLAGKDTRIVRGAFNGVYTFETLGILVPFAKAGAGVEAVKNESRAVNDGFFLDAGAGAKVPFNDYVALKFEALYMAKLGSNNAGFADNNLLVMAGLTFSFGDMKHQEEQKALEKAVVTQAVVVDGDDDKDGVVNSKDSCIYTLPNVQVDALGCALVTDSDGDGVKDTLDKCSNTPNGTKVDASGCKIDTDKDKDGVINEKDLCPNTLLGDIVNSDGCPQTITLKINFENDSINIKSSSSNDLENFANFLTAHRNYSANIVGYSDSVGNAEYNKNLSLKRANQVRALLIDKGAKASQVTAIGMGEANPVASNATEEGRAQNRRIEAELTRK